MKAKKDKFYPAKDCILPLAGVLNPKNSFPPSLRLPNLDIEYTKHNIEKCYIRLQNQRNPASAADFMYRLDECKRRLASWRRFARDHGADRSWTGKELQEHLLGKGQNKTRYSIQIGDEYISYIDVEGWYNNLKDEFDKIHKYLLMLANELEGQVPMSPKKQQQYLMPLHIIPNYFKINRDNLYELTEEGRLTLYHDENGPPLVDATIVAKYVPLLKK